MTDASLKVAVLGLGIMGAGMAARLLARGHQVAVWNRSPAKSEGLGAAGARVAVSPADAAAGADFVLAMLADDTASRDVWLGEQGALAAMASGAVAIECSTLTVDWVRALAAHAAERGLAFIDAPVTGTKPHAAAGTLRFLAGGDAGDLAKAEPLLMSMGTEVVRLGPTGSGALFKLVNNFMCGVQVASLAESLVMLERSGMDLKRTADVLVAGAPGSPLVKMLAERMLSGDYAANFLPGLMAKDLTYAIQAFADQGVDLASAAAAKARFDAAAGLHPDSDMATVIEPIRSRCR